MQVVLARVEGEGERLTGQYETLVAENVRLTAAVNDVKAQLETACQDRDRLQQDRYCKQYFSPCIYREKSLEILCFLQNLQIRIFPQSRQL